MSNGVQATPDQVQSVVRAFAILEILSEHRASRGLDGESHALPLVEIATRAGLAQPTAHRLIRTLVDLGHMKQLTSREYALGPGLISLGDRAKPPLAILSKPFLERLEEVARETANLAVLDGDLITYVGQVPSRHRMRMFTEVGRSVLPHASGVGKAILATLTNDRVKEIIHRTGLPQYTSSTITDEVRLFTDLNEIRRRGYALDDSEQEVGVKCVAVAIPHATGGSSGYGPAAISISGPSARMTDEIVHTAVIELTQAARTLAAA